MEGELEDQMKLLIIAMRQAVKLFAEDEEMLTDIARICGRLKRKLIDEGFTEDQAVALLSSMASRFRKS